MKQPTNKILEGLFSLDHNLKIYVPSTKNVSETIDNTPYVNRLLGLCSDLFGGSTAYQALGAWNSKDKGLVTEKVTIVESYATSEAIENGLLKVLKECKKLKAELTQESIALEYDKKLYFV